MSKTGNAFRRLAARAAGSTLSALQTMFDAGGGAIARIRSWVPISDEINNSVVSDGVTMRNRSRKLIFNNPWASALLDIFVSNSVGNGPIPRPKHPDPVARKRMIDLFDRWSLVCTANRAFDFYGACKLAVRAQRSDGDSFTRLRYRYKSDGLPVGLQLQLIEADCCPLDKEELFPGGAGRIQYGIQFDAIGRRVAYWMYPEHPNGRNKMFGSLEAKPIPAEEIIHMYEIRRPGQERGYPWLTPAIVSLYDLKQLVDASLMRQKISNLLSVWITRAQGNSGFTGEKKDEAAGAGRYETAFGPGTVNYTSGESVQFLQPADAGQNFQSFLNSFLRSIARSLGITFEQLTGDLSGFNLASSRANLLEFRRLMEQWQYTVMIHQFCRPVWNAFIRQAILEGALGDAALREFGEHPEWFDADWTPAAWPWVDPVRDVQSKRDEIRAGFTSRQAECARRGEDAEVIDKQQADDNERADSYGLIYDSDGRVSLGAGLIPSEQQDTQDDNPAQAKGN